MSAPDEALVEGRVGQLLPWAVAIADIDGTLVTLNRAATQILSARTGDRLQDYVTEDDDAVARLLDLAASSGQAVPGRLTLKADQEHTALRIAAARLHLEPDAPARVFLALEPMESDRQVRRFRFLNETIEALRHEVGARKRVEAMLAAQKEVLAAIVGGRPLGEALEILCRAIESESAGMLVSILRLEGSQLQHAAAPSLPADYSAAIDGLEIGPDVGSCGTAAFTGKQVIVTDIATDHRWAPFVDLAQGAGLAACWSTPILASTGEILGTLALYYRTPREPTDDELKLIDDSTLVAGLAIERHLVRERERELLEKTRLERERAKEENRAKDLFLAVLSHELRNPLSAISNAANVLSALGGEDDNRRRLHQVVLNETRQLKRILDDLLDLSRLSRGKFRLQMAPLDVQEFFDEFKAAATAAHPDRDLRFEQAGNAGLMQADRSRLRQSLQNLVDNAIKYSEPDTPVVVKLLATDDAIELVVIDQGEGIDPDLKPRIFDAFVQSDDSLERTRSGLGLGLALVKRFSEMQGGRVLVDSKGVGLGSRFSLVLPRGEVDGAVAEAPSATAANGPCRVLVVEDNDDARMGLCQLLEIWGHQVCSAGDGQAALDMIRSDPPEIALVDIGLPKLNGYQLAEAVREDPELASLRLIALTGYGQEQDRLRARKAGFDDHIVKPADPQDLVRVLGEPVPA